MNGAFYIGAIGLDAQQRALDVVANNIANINTTAFKRSSVQFAELAVPMRDGDGFAIASSNRNQALAGATLAGSPLVWTQGPLRQTGSASDLAISGDGFIELMGSSGREVLWRGGTLQVNTDGYLAVADGTPLQAMISVPQGATGLTISSDGAVSASVSGATQQLGQIDLVRVNSPQDLVSIGSGYYETSDPSNLSTVNPGKDGAGTLVQGSLESSNVELTDEMTNLLMMQRAFSANAQVVQAGDQLMQIVNGLRR